MNSVTVQSKRRVPLWAGALNLLLPGAGYAYCGRWALALFAVFLAVGMVTLVVMRVAPLAVAAGLWALFGVDGLLAANAANRAGAVPSAPAPSRSWRVSAALNVLLPGAGYLHQRATMPAVAAFLFWLLLVVFVVLGASPFWLVPFYGLIVVDSVRLGRARRPSAPSVDGKPE